MSVGIVRELFLFNEDVGKAEVCVQLSGGVNANINVTLNSQEGTATSKIVLKKHVLLNELHCYYVTV